MKIKVTRDIHMMYTDSRTIELEVPDETNDIEAFIRGYLGENDELKDDFSTAKTISSEPLFSEPEHIFYTVENEKGETTQWQDF
jgi:hypothetical protein